jgi:hypothetical protein
MQQGSNITISNIPEGEGSTLRVEGSPSGIEKAELNNVQVLDKKNYVAVNPSISATMDIYDTDIHRIAINMQNRVVYNDPNIQQQGNIKQVGDVQHELLAK